MKRFYVIGFLVLMAFDTLAQISFKYAAMGALPVTADLAWLGRVLAQPWVYVALCGYLGAFFTWMALLRHAPIGPAFAASHLEVLVVMVLVIMVMQAHIQMSSRNPLFLHRLHIQRKSLYLQRSQHAAQLRFRQPQRH